MTSSEKYYDSYFKFALNLLWYMVPSADMDDVSSVDMSIIYEYITLYITFSYRRSHLSILITIWMHSSTMI
jgi:hypothetical protein